MIADMRLIAARSRMSLAGNQKRPLRAESGKPLFGILRTAVGWNKSQAVHTRIGLRLITTSVRRLARHNSSRWIGDPPVSGNQCDFEAAVARIRQAHDLLSAHNADAGGYP